MDTPEQPSPYKRIRSTNWSDLEKKVLRKLVLERAHIIEKKDTTTNTIAAKKIAWEEVLSCFNTVNPIKRDMTQMLNQWRNLKNKAKKSEFAYRRARNMTGGGPSPPSPPPEDQELIVAIPHEFSIDSNCHDSDSIYIKQQDSTQNVSIPSSVLLVQMEPELQNIDDPSPAPFSPVAQPSQASSHLNILDRPGPSGSAQAKKQKTKKLKSDCCKTSHEQQIYMLTRAAREEAMLRDKEAHECKMTFERELHERRMALMVLEDEYWKEKIRKLKEN